VPSNSDECCRAAFLMRFDHVHARSGYTRPPRLHDTRKLQPGIKGDGDMASKSTLSLPFSFSRFSLQGLSSCAAVACAGHFKSIVDCTPWLPHRPSFLLFSPLSCAPAARTLRRGTPTPNCRPIRSVTLPGASLSRIIRLQHTRYVDLPRSVVITCSNKRC
jgi:hypothetical protein